MSGIVELNIDKFRSIYPKLPSSDIQLEQYFIESTMLLDNSKNSCVKNLLERETLLYLLMAHLSALQTRIDNGNDSVGRVSNASEGSVSVGFDNGSTTLSDKWYQQTPYGSKYWALTARYRSFLYIATNTAMMVRR